MSNGMLSMSQGKAIASSLSSSMSAPVAPRSNLGAQALDTGRGPSRTGVGMRGASTSATTSSGGGGGGLSFAGFGYGAGGLTGLKVD